MRAGASRTAPRGCPTTPDERQRQLTRMGNAAWAAGLSLLMLGRRDEAARVARARGRDLPRELAGRAARELGPADRRDEVAAHRRRRRRARARTRAGRSTPAQPSPRARSAATRPRSRELVLGEDDEARPRSCRDARRSETRSRPRSPSSLAALAARDAAALRGGDPGARRGLRGARGVPRGHSGRRHGARAAGARSRAGTGRGTELGHAAAQSRAAVVDVERTTLEVPMAVVDVQEFPIVDRPDAFAPPSRDGCVRAPPRREAARLAGSPRSTARARRRRARARAPSRPGSRSGTRRARRRSRARGSPRSSSRRAT